MPLTITHDKSKLGADAKPPAFNLHAMGPPTLSSFLSEAFISNTKTQGSSSYFNDDGLSDCECSCGEMAELFLRALQHLLGTGKQGSSPISPSSLSSCWVLASGLGIRDSDPHSLE
jgi:hypothetical protein